MGALTDAVKKELGYDTVPQFDPSANVSVGVAAERILDPDPNRLALLIVNLSLNAIFVKPRSDVSSSSGIRLSPSGGTLSLSWREDFHLVGWEWYAIADGADSAIMVLAVSAR